MRINMFFRALFSVLIFFPTVSYASQTLSLVQATREAAEHNPDLKKAEIASDSAGWGKLEALSEHLPHLDVKATHYLESKYSRLGVIFAGNPAHIPSAYPQTSVDLEASILLFDGLGAMNRYRASLFENEAAELELVYARFRLEEWIHIKFNQALAAQEYEKVADQNIETLEQHLKLARASHRAGFSTNIDVLRLESQMEEARAEKILAADNVIEAKNSLMEAMGVEQDPRILVGTLPLPVRKPEVEKLKLEVTKRSDLQAHLRREQAQNRRSAAAASHWFPKLSLFANKQFYKYGDFDPAILSNETFQNAYSVGLNLSWNIFDGGASMAKSARASDLAEMANQDSRKDMLTSPNEFDAWKRKYIYNTALFEARKRSVEKSTESVRLATIAVRAGSKTHAEALDAELELFRARAGVIKAQLDASEALSQLELSVGHRL